MSSPHRRHLGPVTAQRSLASDVREARETAVARYTEVDLLVAALKEHIDDLRQERNRLLEENARLRSELDAARESEAASGARWLIARQRPNR